MADSQTLKQMLTDVLGPLFAAEGGELYLVSSSADAVHLHLGGTLSGSPATPVVAERVLKPAVLAVVPNASVTVSNGYTVPEGAERIGD